MFKKLVTSASLSPAAVGDLALYANRLKSQLPYRIAAVVLTFLALLLQLAIMYAPPESSLPTPTYPQDISVTKNTKSLKYTLEAKNISQGNSDAFKIKAQPSDQILYTLSVKNTSDKPQTTNFQLDLRDVFDYSSILGLNDAELNSTILMWPETIIQPGEDQARTFTIKMAKDISTAPANGLAYDCHMTTAFGKVQDIVVRCSTVKNIETGVGSLPLIESHIPITILIVAFITSVLLLLRNIQYRKEIKTIRKDLAEGTL